MTSCDTYPCAFTRRAPLAERSTLRVGGEADLLLEPADPQQLVETFAWVRERGLTLHLLGGGANTILPDGLIGGAVVTTDRLKRTFRHVPPELCGGENNDPYSEAEPRAHLPEDGGEPILVSWAGTSLPGLVSIAKGLGWSGLEGLAGVPGTLGGGVAMNAGGSWGDLWDVVTQVRVLRGDGEVVDLQRAECSPTYRHGNLGDGIVLGAVLHLKRSTKKEVADAVASYLKHKRDVQPVTEASAGCVFKNPDPNLSGGKSAGRLIEEAGLKGASRGRALVSPKHGNFIVNTGGATAADVIALIEHCQMVVAERFDVALEREVKIWHKAGDAKR